MEFALPNIAHKVKDAPKLDAKGEYALIGKPFFNYADLDAGYRVHAQRAGGENNTPPGQIPPCSRI